MRRIVAPISVALVFFAFSVVSVAAQMAQRNYDKGAVTLVIQYVVKPGQLNGFMQDFAKTTLRFIQAGEKEGRVTGYAIQQPIDARPGEPNLALVITFKSLSAYDRPFADTDKDNIAVYGSVEKAQAAAMQRLNYATPAGRLLLQSLILSK